MLARGIAPLHTLLAFPLVAGTSLAADVPPEVVRDFTQRVQPLVVNRCAAGACHGGATAHEPRFERGPASARPDRVHTLANMQTFLDAVGTDRDPQRLVTLLAGRHPASSSQRGPAAAPLTASERITIESWLAAVRAAEGKQRGTGAVRQVSADLPADPAPPRNRFRDLLDSAANPPAFEEPQPPRGVIFRPDDGEATEPPAPPPLP